VSQRLESILPLPLPSREGDEEICISSPRGGVEKGRGGCIHFYELSLDKFWILGTPSSAIAQKGFWHVEGPVYHDR
jgi:hypothetical protein